jgi:probable rRNA maturation factor
MVKPFVRFGYADRRLVLKRKRVVQSFLVELVVKEAGVPCQLQYVFCSDEYLYRMNQSFLNHDDYTDIITFDLSAKPQSLIEGEIYISLDRVLANSKELGVPFDQEILRVIFHGALHLCGFSDKTKAQKLEMRGKEDQYLKLFGML